MGTQANAIGPLEEAAMALVVRTAEELGVSQRRLGELAGISKSRIHKLLTGQVACTVSSFADMCEALGTTASEMLRRAEDSLGGYVSQPGATVQTFPGYGEDVVDAPDVSRMAALDDGTDWRQEQEDQQELP